MPWNLDHFGCARIEFGTSIAALRKLEETTIEGLKHVFLVLRKGKRSCGASMSTARVSLYLVNPQMHRAPLEAVFKRIAPSGRKACKPG